MPIAREIFFVGSMGVAVNAPLTYFRSVASLVGLGHVAEAYLPDTLDEQLREVGSIKASIPLAAFGRAIPAMPEVERHRIRIDLRHVVAEPKVTSMTWTASGTIDQLTVSSLATHRQWDLVISTEAARGPVLAPDHVFDQFLAGPIVAGAMVAQLPTDSHGPIQALHAPDGLHIVSPVDPDRRYRTPEPQPVVVSPIPPGGPSS